MKPTIDIPFLLEVAQKAGEEILKIYNSDFAVEMKDDNSPLTLADRKSNDCIVAALQKTYPDIPIMSEESIILEYQKRKEGSISGAWIHWMVPKSLSREMGSLLSILLWSIYPGPS